MTDRPPTPPQIRLWTPDDIDAIVACHRAAYAGVPGKIPFTAREFRLQYDAFPQGQFLAECDGHVVGYAACLIVQLTDSLDHYSYAEITGGGTFATHEPGGDTLYGADIAVHPHYRGRGIAGLLYRARSALLSHFNLRRMLAYGRIPGYAAVAGKMDADQYVQAVLDGRLKDSALNTHLKAGYQVRGVILDLMADEASLNYCTLLEKPNPDFDPARRMIAAYPLQRPVRSVRVCAAQYMMRNLEDWDAFARTVDFFADIADEHHSHFLVLPEYFTAQLISLMPRDWDDRRCFTELARMHDRYCDLMRHMAAEHQCMIVAGSTPVLRENLLYNVAHLFTPAGHIYTQDKLHVTPYERRVYGIQPGAGLNVFDTPFGRIAIQICYDVEFPETVRLLTLAGVEILFVPYSTDERKGHFRVRATAQARAIENYIYVIIAGNVGNLPNSKSYLTNYGQAAIFTPSDFAFPMNATLNEGEVNQESVAVADLDLQTLAKQRQLGSVRPLFDRRPDLYDLTAKIPITVIKVE